jgi:hypothetical protein
MKQSPDNQVKSWKIENKSVIGTIVGMFHESIHKYTKTA